MTEATRHLRGLQSRNFWPVVLMVSCIPMGEAWHLWNNQDYEVDCFLLIDLKVHIQWVVKDTSDNLSWICVCLALYLLSRRINEILARTSLVLLLFKICELGLYFLNFKRSGYGMVYIILSVSYYFLFMFKQHHK